MFLMIVLQEYDKAQFALTWERLHYIFNRLPRGFKFSPTVAHSALGKVLKENPSPLDIEYIDDILIGGKNAVEV